MTASMTLAETAYIARILPPAAKDAKRPRVWAIMMAGITALAMVSATATPAQADRHNNDTLKALAAIAVVALIAKAAKDKKQGHTRPVPVRSPVVPSVCAIEIGSGRGSVTGYAGRCLTEEGFNYRLPNTCATDIRIYGRADRFYTEQCLQDAGFTTRPY